MREMLVEGKKVGKVFFFFFACQQFKADSGVLARRKVPFVPRKFLLPRECRGVRPRVNRGSCVRRVAFAERLLYAREYSVRAHA